MLASVDKTKLVDVIIKGEAVKVAPNGIVPYVK